MLNFQCHKKTIHARYSTGIEKYNMTKHGFKQMEKIIFMYVNVIISPVVICNYCFLDVLIKGFVLLNVTTTSFFSVA